MSSVSMLFQLLLLLYNIGGHACKYGCCNYPYIELAERRYCRPLCDHVHSDTMHAWKVDKGLLYAPLVIAERFCSSLHVHLLIKQTTRPG